MNVLWFIIGIVVGTALGMFFWLWGLAFSSNGEFNIINVNGSEKPVFALMFKKESDIKHIADSKKDYVIFKVVRK